MAFCNQDLSFWKNGPQPGSFYDFPRRAASANVSNGKQHTLTPTVTGTSVLGMTFNGGVIIAADMLGSYGSMAMFRNCERLMKVNSSTVIGGSGDYADFQYIKHIIEEKVIEDDCMSDGFHMTPKALHSWMTRVMYYRRTKFDPLWNRIIVAGLENGKPYLGQVDNIGSAFEAPAMATGYGAYIALPMLRDAQEKNPAMTEREARALIDKCLKVLYYRDGRSFNKYQLAVITTEGTKIEGPYSSHTDWSIAHLVTGYA